MKIVVPTQNRCQGLSGSKDSGFVGATVAAARLVEKPNEIDVLDAGEIFPAVRSHVFVAAAVDKPAVAEDVPDIVALVAALAVILVAALAEDIPAAVDCADDNIVGDNGR